MPTYQYACTECGHAFEQVQSFADAALSECPVCAGRLRKVYNAVGVVFKGSGFYRNDSRSEKTSSIPSGSSSSDSSGSGSSDSGSSDSGSSGDKPAAAKEGSSSSTEKKSDSKPAAAAPASSSSSSSS